MPTPSFFGHVNIILPTELNYEGHLKLGKTSERNDKVGLGQLDVIRSNGSSDTKLKPRGGKAGMQ